MSDFSSEGSPSKKRRKCKFKEISGSLSKEELIRRLKSAAQELTNIDQGDETSEFDGFAASLVVPYILNHSDKDVKSYVACCLADILRIYAPEPPFNEIQLKDVLRLLMKQLKGLENVNGPAYKRHFYVLESLSLVKTFNVLLDLEAQDIILDTFKLFFTIISDKHNIRVKSMMIDVMSPLIQESDWFPQEVLTVILVHLIEPRKNKYPESYKLACDLLDRCASSIEPYIQLFFNNSFILGGEMEPELSGHLYDLLFELYKVNKAVLLSVLPQLEFKLKGNKEDDRLEAIKLLGRMFADDDSSLADSHKALWSCYLGRFLDISADVRVECVKISRSFLLSDTLKLQSDVAEKIVERFHDPDEKVRFETVLAVCEAAAEKFDAIPQEVIDGVKERMRDKKWSIRREAITCVGKLYKKTMASNTVAPSTIENISWVPQKVLQLYPRNTIEDRLCIERVFHGCVIPVTLDIEKRMKRLLSVFLSLDDYGMTIFDGMMKHRAKVNEDFCSLVQTYTEEMEDQKEKEKLIYAKVLSVARALPEPFKGQEHLKKLMMFCKDDNFTKLLLMATDNTQECPKILKTVGDILKKITSKSPVIDTVKALLDRACPMLIDKPSFSVLLKNIKQLVDGISVFDEDDDSSDGELLEKAKKALRLVKTFAIVRPTIFESNQANEQLLLFVKHSDDEIVELSLEILYHIICNMKEVDKKIFSYFQTVLSKLVTRGTCKQSKYALRCLYKMNKDSNQSLERLYKNLVDNLSVDSSFSSLQTTISSLSEIAILSPKVFERKYKEIICEFAVKQVLTVDREKNDKNSQDSNEEEWTSDQNVSEETQIKIKAIKLLTNWLLGLQINHKERSASVFRLLYTMLNHDGDLNANGKISAPDRSRLRLTAAKAMIKLLQNSQYVDFIQMDHYLQLSLVMQDSCFEVRDQFTTKLQKALSSLKMALDYYAFYALVAADPSKERRNKVRLLIAHNAQTRREYIKQHSAAAARPFAILPEYSLPYVVYLLAHHPDFNPKNSDSVQQTKDCLWFFLEPIMGAKAENYSFLKKLLENIKQTKDKENPEDKTINEKIYFVCDLAVACIMKKNQTFTLKDFPGNVVLPKKLFISEKGSKNNSKSYLPKNFVISPKKGKSNADAKAAPKQSDALDKRKTKKRAVYSRNQANSESDSESEKESPKKRIRYTTEDKKLNGHAHETQSKTKNTRKNKLQQKERDKTPVSEDSDNDSSNRAKKKNLSSKSQPVKPLNKPSSQSESDSSPSKRYPSRKSTASPMKTSSNENSLLALEESFEREDITNKKQSKLDRFWSNGKKKNKEDVTKTNDDSQSPASNNIKIQKTSPKKASSKPASVKKSTKANIKSTSPKKFDKSNKDNDNIEKDEKEADVDEASRVSTSPKKKRRPLEEKPVEESQTPDEKPANKLQTRRKGRLRR